MATVEDCEAALHALSARLAEKDPSSRDTNFDRSLSCTLRDLDVTFTGRLVNGELTSIVRSPRADAQIRLDLTSDDLLKLVDGSLNVASAWATGRLKIGAGVRDKIRLRSIF